MAFMIKYCLAIFCLFLSGFLSANNARHLQEIRPRFDSRQHHPSLVLPTEEVGSYMVMITEEGERTTSTLSQAQVQAISFIETYIQIACDRFINMIIDWLDEPKAKMVPEPVPAQYDQATYVQVDPRAPTPPSRPPPSGQTTCGRVDPKAPTPPNRAPSQGHTTYGRGSPPNVPTPPNGAPSEGQTTLGRDKPKTPPSPKVSPSRGQSTYGRENSSPPPPPKPNGSQGQTTYGREDTRTPPTPSPNGSRGQSSYSLVQPRKPPLPSPAELSSPVLSTPLHDMKKEMHVADF